MNGLRISFRKKSIQKFEKSINQSEIAACEQKTTSEKAIVVQTLFSHCTLKLKRKNFTTQNHTIFCSISCFGVTKITTPI